MTYYWLFLILLFKSRESKNEHYENKLRALSIEIKNKQKVLLKISFFFKYKIFSKLKS